MHIVFCAVLEGIMVSMITPDIIENNIATIRILLFCSIVPILSISSLIISLISKFLKQRSRNDLFLDDQDEEEREYNKRNEVR